MCVLVSGALFAVHVRRPVRAHPGGYPSEQVNSA